MFKSCITTIITLVALLLSISCSKDYFEEPALDSLDTSFTQEDDTFVSLSDVKNYIGKELLSTRTDSNRALNILPYVESDTDTLLYIINYGNNTGWKILSSDTRTPAILAESDYGSFSLENGNPSVAFWLKGVAEDIKAVRRASDSELTFTADEIAFNKSIWNSKPQNRDGDNPPNPYIDEDGYWDVTVTNEVETVESVNHLTPHWTQGIPYNQYCPLKSDNSGGRAPAGCVAVAGAEVLYYLHELLGAPTNMVSSGSCVGYVHNFSQSFDSPNSSVWALMSPEYTNSSYANLPEAVMIGHVGSLVEMNYNNGYSWAFPSSLKSNVFENYGYSCSSGSYDENTVKSNLENLIPVIVTATDQLIITDFDIHCFVIDGYRKTRAKTTRHYVWVQGELSNFTPDPSEYTEVSYSYQGMTSMKINWGWSSQWISPYYNDGWYAFTGGWVVNNGGTYDYDYNKTMIYGFSLN